MIGTDPFFHAVTGVLAELAASHAIPALSFHRQFALSGGLISYGATLTEEHRLAGLYERAHCRLSNSRKDISMSDG